MPNGKYYLMKMIRRQVAMKQREAKEKAEHKNPLKVHILRSYKQVLADKLAHPVGSKSKLKALAEAKLKKAKVSSPPASSLLHVSEPHLVNRIIDRQPRCRFLIPANPVNMPLLLIAGTVRENSTDARCR
jgi:hypothetical protein